MHVTSKMLKLNTRETIKHLYSIISSAAFSKYRWNPCHKGFVYLKQNKTWHDTEQLEGGMRAIGEKLWEIKQVYQVMDFWKAWKDSEDALPL